MPSRHHLLFGIALGAVALTGCEEVVDLDAGAPAQLVVDARLESGRLPIVAVRALDGFGRETKSADLPAASGSLRVSDGTTTDLRDFFASDSITILLGDNGPVVEGLTYTLTLKVPGFAQVKSFTTVPRPAGVRAGGLTGDTGGSANQVTIPVSFLDRGEGLDYYHLLVYVGESTDLANALPSDARPVPFQLVAPAQRALSINTEGYYFQDGAFVGGIFDRDVIVGLDATRTLREPTVYLELRTVSDSYYAFYNTGSHTKGVTQTASANFAAQADNISGGSGVFAGYSSTILGVRIDR